MPRYDLRCTRCQKEFEVWASMSDRADKLINCPECGSKDIESVFRSAPAYIKGLKEPSCPHTHVCGAGCPHASH